MHFQLRDNLHFCVANDRVVFLDLVSNRYFCLPWALDAIFQKAVSGGGDFGTSAESFVHMGILEPVGSQSEWIGTSDLPSPSMAIDSTMHSGGWISLAEAFFCRQRAAHALRGQSLLTLIDRVRARSARRNPQTDRTFDADLAGDVVTFARSRHIVSTLDQCLCSSVALLDFLYRRRFYPRLVIGVKMSPFSAHAWIQYDDIVLADEVDNVRPFTPILVM